MLRKTRIHPVQVIARTSQAPMARTLLLLRVLMLTVAFLCCPGLPAPLPPRPVLRSPPPSALSQRSLSLSVLNLPSSGPSSGIEGNGRGSAADAHCRLCDVPLDSTRAICAQCSRAKNNRQRARRAPRNEPKHVREARRYELRLAQMGQRPFTVEAFCNHSQFFFDKARAAPRLASDARLERVKRPGLVTYRRRLP